MASSANYRIGAINRSMLKWLVFASCFALAFMVVNAGAQPPKPDAAGDGSPLEAPAVPEMKARPAADRDLASSFVESLSANSKDGVLEVETGLSKILTTKVDLAAAGKPSLIALADPSVADFTVLSPRQIRITGHRIGETDLSIITPDGQTHSFRVSVTANLDMLRTQLHNTFPDAYVKLSQMREHVIVEGEARDKAQVAQILETIRAYLISVQAAQARRITGQSAPPAQMPPVRDRTAGQDRPARHETGSHTACRRTRTLAGLECRSRYPSSRRLSTGSVYPAPSRFFSRSRIAELNRTALRQIGADFLGIVPGSGATFGSQIGGSTISASGTAAARTLLGTASVAASPLTTAYGIFEKGDFEIFFSALRQNSLLKILAEPNLVTMSGHRPPSWMAANSPCRYQATHPAVPPRPPSSGRISVSSSVSSPMFRMMK